MTAENLPEPIEKPITPEEAKDEFIWESEGHFDEDYLTDPINGAGDSAEKDTDNLGV